MNLLISLRSEILKTKRTAALYFTLIGAAVVPFMFLLNAFGDGLPDEERSNKDPLNAMFRVATEMNGIAIFPLFVVLLCTLLPQIEHKNNTWKQVLASPKPKATIFAAKFLNILLLIIAFQITSYLLMWVVAIAIHFIIPETNVLHHSLDSTPIFISAANSFITVLAIATIQFWIGLRSKNFLAPIAIGLGLWLAGTVMVFEYHSPMSKYFPYSFHIFPFSSGVKPALNQVAWTSIGYATVFLLLGFLDFSRRRMTG